MNRRLSELVKIYDHTLEPSVCESMIRLFDHSTTPATVRNDGVRSFAELSIDGSPEWYRYHHVLEQTKETLLEQYKRDVPGRFPDQHDYEAFRLKRYDSENKDRFTEHVDSYDLYSSRRFLVCFWYLNDVEEGGETIFPHLGMQCRPRVGRAILFPPYWMYEHAALPPLLGSKYIVSTYFHYLGRTPA